MSGNGTEVTVDWGMCTRQSDDGREIRAGGGWVALHDFEDLVAPWHPGDSGATTHDGSARCFWVAPGLREPDPDAGLSLAVTTSDEDGGYGQGPINATVYLHIGWNEVVNARTTYRAMAEAALYWAEELGKVPPPTGELHGFRATLPPMDPPALALLIRRLGLKRVAGVAALLLQGQVVLITPPRQIHGTAGRTDEDIFARLDWLDAVAALLPYGYRADLTVSTGAFPGAQHRLCFATRAASQASVDLARPLPPRPRGVAEEYGSLMVELVERHRHRLDDVVRHLALRSDLRLHMGPDPALDALRVLDRPHQIWLAVAEPREVDADEIRAVLDDARQRAKIPDSEVCDLARALLQRLDPRDADLLAAHLTPSQLPYLVDAVDEVLKSDQEPQQVAWLFSVADRVGVIENLLDELLRLSPRFFRWRRPRKRDRVLPLVAAALDPPDPAAWPILRSSVRDDLQTAYDIVAAQLRGPDGVAAATRTTAWLAAGPDSLPDELVLLDALVRGDADPAAVEAARQGWPTELARRLTAVQVARVTPEDLERLWAWRHAGHIDPVPDRDGLERIADSRTSVSDVVRLDLLGLLADGRPLLDLDRRLGAFTGAEDYVTEFAARFWSLTVDDRWAASRRIAEHLDGLDWAADPVRAAIIIALLHQLRTHPAGPQVGAWSTQHFLDTVAAAVAAHPELEQLEVYGTLWLGNDGDGDGDGAVRGDWPTVPLLPSDPHALIGQLRRDGDKLDLVTFVARVARILQYDDPRVTDELFDALRGSRHLRSGLDIHDFLVLVWQKLLPFEFGDPDEVYWSLIRAVHRGDLGDDAARRFGAHVRSAGPSEFRRWSQELFEAGMPSEEIGRLLDEIADESRRRGQAPDAGDPDEADDPEEGR